MSNAAVKPLGKIKKIPLRDVWPNEANNFTKWLAKDENLTLLGDEIGMELELIEAESSVGAFNADIYAKEVGTGRKVIIENQLEATNHDHLGKIITYASGKEAEVIVWLVSKAREEHQRAIEWLNEHTDMEIGFFLIEMALWSIDGSNPALKYNVIEQPNNWAKTVKASDNLNETDKARLQYWQYYNEKALSNATFVKEFRPHKPSTDHWSNLAVGSSQYHIALLVYKDKKIGIEICVPDNKEIGQFFIDNKNTIENILGVKGEPYMATKSSGVRFFNKSLGIKQTPELWDECVNWHINSALKIKKALLSMNIPK